MRPGDLLLKDGLHWTVRAVDRQSRLATILNEDLKVDWIPLDLDRKQPDACRVICNPAEQWPFVAISARAVRGKLVMLSRSAVDGQVPLTQWVDWVSADPMRLGGGPVFMNPALNLRPSETLIATFENKSSVRVTIPLSFGTVSQRKARLEAKPKPEKTSFDRLLDDEDPYGESD